MADYQIHINENTEIGKAILLLLKNSESVKIEAIDSPELSNEYKKSMDLMLENHQNGEVNYSNWSDVKNDFL